MTGAKEILLAEDEQHIAKLIEYKLKKIGFSVTLARDGQEAIDLFPQKPWGLIILDVMMPKRNGWEVLVALRASSYAHIPVLVLSAKVEKLDISTAASLGVTQYLRKPFDPDELCQNVKKLCNEAFANETHG